jgi:hypothetical protein
MRARRGVLAGAALVAVLPVVAGTASAGAAEGDQLSAQTDWTYEFEDEFGNPASCHLYATASLTDFVGTGNLFVVGDWYCGGFATQRLELSYTDRYGNPATVRGTGSNGPTSLEADDVGSDLVVTATGRFECGDQSSGPHYCETSRTLTPK